jgi:predicted metal-dependent HD superfamily phosphohydrolase
MTQPEIEIRRAWRHLAGHEHDGYVDALLLRYAEPHRYYHTATHIMMVVRYVHDVLATRAEQPSPELVAAALYHDAIYDPHADDNEARSAALAIRDLTAIGWTTRQCRMVNALIIATAGHIGDHPPLAKDTAHHAAVDDDIAAATSTLVDADLAILGADPLTYQAYVAGVRAEYFFVDDEHWRVGRGRVLRHFLESQPLFTTEYMRAQFEHRALANIHAELAALQPGAV